MSVHECGSIDGIEVEEIRLATAAGASASILTYGAILRDLVVPMGDGAHRRVVLGYDNPTDYAENPCYLGATIGRHFSRIAKGRFVLDGVEYRLDVDGTGNSGLHGGAVGFSRRHWRIVEEDVSSVCLALTSHSGDQGYPGRLEATCRYRLLDDATLRVHMTATTDAPTLVNMTHHSYFTLEEGADSHDHVLSIAADFYSPLGPDLLPTGEISKVEGTPFDFRAPRRIGLAGIAYDANWVLGGERGRLSPVACVRSPRGDLELAVATTEPGLLLYDGSGLMACAPGPDGQIHGPRRGFCLEAQRFVDSPNHRHFPTTALRPGETYETMTEYRFGRTR